MIYVTQRAPFGTGETLLGPAVEALLTPGTEPLMVPRLSPEGVVHDNVDALLRRTRVLPGPAAVLIAVLHSLARAPRATIGAFWRLRRTRALRRTDSNAIATAQGLWLAHEVRRWGADHIHAHWAHLTATLAMAASA